MIVSEARALELLEQGAPEAIEVLYDLYGRLAYTVAIRMLKDGSAAEDVVQESFLSIWRRINTFQPGRGTLRSWVCTIVRNRSIDRIRSKKGQTRYELPIEAATSEPSLSNTWAEVAADLTRQQVTEALAELPAEQRQTIELAYYGGYSQSEIGQLMNVPLGTVKGRARMAITKLRTTLAGEEVSWQST